MFSTTDELCDHFLTQHKQHTGVNQMSTEILRLDYSPYLYLHIHICWTLFLWKWIDRRFKIQRQ